MSDAIGICASVPSVTIRERLNQSFRALVSRENRNRVPVTQQFVARCLAAEKQGIPISHPAKHCFQNVLYDSIIKMVAMHCDKYTTSCKTEVDDLVHDCFLRIIKRIGTFDHRKALFTTWCWKVCQNTLNSRYRTHIRQTSKLADGENIEILEPAKEDTTVLANDMANTIREIALRYPKKRRMLYAIFGNPNNRNFHLPSKVKLSEVARDAGMKYHDVYVFYKKVVRPIFRDRFSARSIR